MVRTLTCIDRFLDMSLSVPACHHPFLTMKGCVPCHARSRSLACKVPSLVMSVPVPTCKVLFLNVQGSVPSCHDLFSHMLVSVPTWHDLSFASHALYQHLSLSSSRPRSEHSAHLMISAISSKMGSAPWHMDTATSPHK